MLTSILILEHFEQLSSPFHNRSIHGEEVTHEDLYRQARTHTHTVIASIVLLITLIKIHQSGSVSPLELAPVVLTLAEAILRALGRVLRAQVQKKE